MESWGATKGFGEAPKSRTRKKQGSATNSIAKRGQGAIAPCGVQRQRLWWGLGQRPNRSTVKPIMLNALNPAALVAGSAASLRSNFARPQTRPQAAFPTTYTLSRQMDATDQHREKSFSLGAGLFRCREISPLRRRGGGFALAPSTPSQCTPMLLDFYCCRRISHSPM